jgi:hypothetical protein
LLNFKLKPNGPGLQLQLRNILKRKDAFGLRQLSLNGADRRLLSARNFSRLKNS